jgi:hypothetical protein
MLVQGMQGSIIKGGCKVQDSRRAQGQVRQRSVIQSSGAKVQDDRQAQGQVRQRLVIQSSGAKVQDDRQAQGRQNGQNRETRKWEHDS